MGDTSVKTGVDALIDLLKRKKNVSLQDAAKELNLTEQAVKQWVDFLVEEKIVGVEYKFTKPYIYLNEGKEEHKSRVIEQEKINISLFKDDFVKRAKSSNIPDGQIEFLWKDHIVNQLELEKEFFYREARKHNLEKIDELWQEYYQRVVGA